MRKYFINLLKYIKRSILRSILVLKTRKLLPGFITTLFLGYDYQSLKFENIENYTLAQPQKVKLLFNTAVILSYCPPRFDSLNSEKNHMNNVEGFNNYAAILTDVEVIGGSNVVILDNYHALYDLKYNDVHKKMYYSDQGIRCYDNDYMLVKKINTSLSIDNAILLGGNFSWNYYHLLYEVFIKFQKIDETVLDYSIPLLVDKICFDTPQFCELLSLLNVKNRKIIPLDRGKRYSTKQLYYFSCPTIIPPDLVNVNDALSEDVLFDLETVGFIRRGLIPHSSKRIFPKRIFISRSKASGRRSFNEDQVFKIFEKYNFKKIFPEDYSLIDQISLFNNAEFIAGGAGAAFTNLIFCKESCKVITFAKIKSPFSGFSTIAKYVGVDMLLFTEEYSESNKIIESNDPFIIDTKRVEALVLEWV